jgi:hypothetical protein
MFGADRKIRFYVTEQLSPKMHRTPEGFLLCQEVPIARTGNQIYGPDETPVEVGANGNSVTILREEDQVFRPETIASFNGKPVVDEHPNEGEVTPANWKELSIGVVLDPRRGTGVQSDLLIADLLITDIYAIEEILKGKREVSCGYDADYEQFEPGRGRQFNIVGNHVALVDSARCGSRCSIRDNAYEGEKKMKWKDVKKKIRDAFQAKDCDGMNKALESINANDEEEVPGSEGGAPVHVHMGRSKYTDEKLDEMFSKYDQMHATHQSSLASHDESMAALAKKVEERPDAVAAAGDGVEGSEPSESEIEGELMEEAPPGTSDKARKAKDSAFLDESFQATIALAEIIVPGIRIPTFDRASKPGDTLKVICGLRRKTLQQGVKDADTLEMVKELRSGKTLDDAALKTMKCGAVRDLFLGLGAMKKAFNNSSSARTTDGNVIRTAGGGLGINSAIKNPADLNKKYAEFYKQ